MLLMPFHCCFLIVAFPESSGEDLHASVVHLLPAVEAASLAHRTDPARAHVVHIMEKHLVPPVAAAQAQSHEPVQPRPRALWVCGQELVPLVRVVMLAMKHQAIVKPRRKPQLTGSTNLQPSLKERPKPMEPKSQTQVHKEATNNTCFTRTGNHLL